jgi:hypothetical protein
VSRGLSCTAWRTSPLRRFLRRSWRWAIGAWIVVGWLLVIPAWFYLGAPL